MNRKDIDPKKYSRNCNLYRGGGLTAAEIKEYSDNIGKEVSFFGYTSFSLVDSVALGFAWQDKHSGHQKVLFHLNWNNDIDHYFLNAGAYDYESEVLLLDGTYAYVISVEAITDTDDKFLYTLIKLRSLNYNQILKYD